MFEYKKISYRYTLLLQSIALILLGALLLMTLSFTMVRANAGVVIHDTGYGLLGNFALCLNPSSPASLRARGWACAFCWIILLCGLAALIAGVFYFLYCFASKSLSDSRRFSVSVERTRLVLIVALSVTLALFVVYMIMGLVLRGRSIRDLGETIGAPSDTVRKMIQTFAYVPLILFLVYGFAIGVIKTLFLEKMPARADAKSSGMTERERLNLLAEYKRLYDEGVLTEKEFRGRKEKLLFPEEYAASSDAPQPPTEAEPSEDTDGLRVLAEYKRLYDEGILSEEEFRANKEKILFPAQPAPTVGADGETDGISEDADRLNLLAEYKRLRDEGILTEEEFAERKRALLSDD